MCLFIVQKKRKEKEKKILIKSENKRKENKNCSCPKRLITITGLEITKCQSSVVL